MKNLMVVCFAMFMALDVYAQAPEVEETPQEPVWTLGVLSDLGMVFKGREGNHTNAVINLGLALIADVDVSDKWRLGFGIGIPSGAAAPSLNIPLSARLMPFGARNSGIYLQGQIVPTYGHGTPCVFDDRCDIPFPNKDEGRHYSALGVIGKVGGGFQINFRPVWFFLDGAISTAYFKGLETDDGYAIDDGIYIGGEMALGLRFPF